MWVLGMAPESSGRAASAFTFQAFCPAPGNVYSDPRAQALIFLWTQCVLLAGLAVNVEH